MSKMLGNEDALTGYRFAVFVLFTLLVLLSIGTAELESSYAALGNKSSSKGSGVGGILFCAPLALVLLSAIIPATGLMYLVAVLLIPFALLSLILVFAAPPFGVPGCLVFGVWYSYFFAFRRLRRAQASEFPPTESGKYDSWE